MKKILLIISIFACAINASAQKPDTLWYQYPDRFVANSYIALDGIDSLEFTKTSVRKWKKSATTGSPQGLPTTYFKENGVYRFDAIERYLAKPSGYSNVNYSDENSQWCFQRSMESEHFVVFWEKGSTLNVKTNTVSFSAGGSVNVKTLLTNGEKIWKKYVEELGFLVPGKSVTDNTKIHMYLKNQSDWRADGSGQSGSSYYYDGSTRRSKSTPVGLFHCNPSAATARGGHTPAHEIGHVFQYLVSADLGQSHGLNYGFGTNASGGNCWWEDCANWQAYKVYPERQFTDGEYFEQYMTKHHQNILHEDSRYANCFYHDYWCMKHGMNTIGRVWRESNKPEDPMEAYMRIFGLSLDDFAAEMYDCFARMATWDIDGVRDRAKAKIGAHLQRLVEPTATVISSKLDGDNSWWVVDPDFCPQNYGYNINPLKIPAAGAKVKVTFRGIAGASGYRSINVSKAGWRYGLVAYTTKGERVYSEMQSNANDGVAEITIPENCRNLWLVVMGAPTEYWRHPWDDNVSNDEQWPYAVKFEGSGPLGASRTYGEYPEDYERKDTTVVINASLTYSSTSYTSVRVQYDMDAISQALGVSTKQMQALKSNDTTSDPGELRFAGVNANGTTFKYNTTTSTSSSTCYGHWFTTAGNVCEYGTTSGIFAELYPDKYGCYVGQYPGRLTKGKTYTIRQAIVYTHTDGKEYKAIMEVHLTIN